MGVTGFAPHFFNTDAKSSKFIQISPLAHPPLGCVTSCFACFTPSALRLLPLVSMQQQAARISPAAISLANSLHQRPIEGTGNIQATASWLKYPSSISQARYIINEVIFTFLRLKKACSISQARYIINTVNCTSCSLKNHPLLS